MYFVLFSCLTSFFCLTPFGVTFFNNIDTFTSEHLLSNGHRKPVFFFLFLEKKYLTFSNMFIFSSGQISDQVMSGIPVRVYEPESSIQRPNRPVLLYLHGGGWTFLSIGKLVTIVFFSTSSI